MKKYINIAEKYILDEDRIEFKEEIYKNNYDFYEKNILTEKTIENIFPANLPTDIDIFKNLPNSIYKNNTVRNFLNSLRKVLLNTYLENITFSKLVVSEVSNTGVVLDWIYNYFRIYFSFDTIEGNFYGYVSYNKERGYYENKFSSMFEKDFEEIAELSVEYVIKMLNRNEVNIIDAK